VRGLSTLGDDFLVVVEEPRPSGLRRIRKQTGSVGEGGELGSLSSRAVSWLAWALCAATLLILAMALVLVLLGWSTLPRGSEPWRAQALSLVGIIGAPILGGLVASRRPHNTYGWLWLGFGWGLALQSLAMSYAAYARVVEQASLVAPLTISHVLGLGGPLAPFLLLLFPTGRLPSRRWRLLAWLAAMSGIVLVLLNVLFERPDEAEGPVTVMVTAVVLLIFAAVLLSALSLVVRYFRASAVGRQQLKWFALAAMLAASYFAGELLHVYELLGAALWNLLNAATITILYAAVGLAILRYRLYDIDILINRALVYGALTATVLALYVLIVGILGTLFQAHGDLAVSLVTAGVVAVVSHPFARVSSEASTV